MRREGRRRGEGGADGNGQDKSKVPGPGADFIFAAISPCFAKISAARSRQPFILFSFAPTKEGERVMRLVHSNWQDARCPSKRKRRVGTLRPTVSLCLFSASLRLCIKPKNRSRDLRFSG